ncbi:MAG: osmoprotectant transporter activator [Betaproteobacteria bacterium]|jgi:ProP effector|nr:osmoprotectant transporter activator [Betaproteobacteria bacterium]MBK8320568.1 osmoprotectant transporter activator [Betaproteobacteria bacterium]MBK9783931.1 osmoprotectant transporter activator [Candidatus Dechloromonas phosphorivorans]MBP8169374.1 osmoprotectant transporter activator [Azonexus sp.]
MTTTEPSTEPTLSKPIDARALLKDIHARFDVFRNHSPLAIGIDRQIFALLPDLEKKALRLAMRSHTISTRYLKEMEKGTVRLNLDGTPAGEVTDENRQHAAELLRERFKKQAEQRKAGEAATKAAEAEAKAAEAAIKAEAERLEKLSQLAEKFGRKGR